MASPVGYAACIKLLIAMWMCPEGVSCALQIATGTVIAAAVASLLALASPIIDATINAFPDGEGATTEAELKQFNIF
jgi:hypothetical protein